MKHVWLMVLLLSFGVAHGQDTMTGRPVQVGSRAPALDPVAWMAKTHAEEQLPGMFRLVEFTHLYCKPCRELIPHLTRLRQIYGSRLAVISIYTYFEADRMEESEYCGKIETLMQAMGAQMDFSVGLDSRDRRLQKSWQGVPVIFPTAYLVDPAGTIIWVGNGNAAIDELDSVLPNILNGSYDAGAYYRQKADHKQVIDGLQELHRSGQRMAAIRGVDSLMRENEFDGRYLRQLKFRFFLDTADRGARASAYLQGVVDSDSLFVMEPGFFVDNYFSYPEIDRMLGINIAKRKLNTATDYLSVADAHLLIARMYAQAGDYANAYAWASKGRDIWLMHTASGNAGGVSDTYQMFVDKFRYVALSANDLSEAHRWLGQQLDAKMLRKSSITAIRKAAVSSGDQAAVTLLDGWLENNGTTTQRNGK